MTLDEAEFRAWKNADTAIDVDASSSIEPLDALLVINTINADGSRMLPESPGCDEGPPPFYDTNGDGWAAPIDALLVINFLNARAEAAVAADAGRVAAIPEPSSVSLLLLGTLIIALRRPNIDNLMS